ncbi:MAG: universal stress protein [Gemmatimonadetes bacterium]|nr:universal stress protein [Gemmatimonadota bacterium]
MTSQPPPRRPTLAPSRPSSSIDDGSVSEEIIADALAVAGPEATYHLVHVVVPVRWLPPPSAFEVVTAGSADAADAVDSADTAERLSAKRDAAVRHVAAVAERLRTGVQVRTHIPVHQSPAEAILAYAHECGASLIAMTSHGRGATARLLIGSVADKVVRGATVPVLVRVPAHR